MSAVIKFGNGSGHSAVRPLPASATASRKLASKDDEERERLQRRITVLEEEVRRKEAVTASLQAEVGAAFERGKELGHESGRAEADGRERERLTMLEDAMREAQTRLSAEMSSLERLAALLARDSLEIILGEPDYRHELLAAIIAKQVAEIDKQALVEITVSSQDFPDQAVLADVAERAQIASSVIAVGAGVPAGSCMMKLRLGHQDIGLNRQWPALRARLTELSLPEAAE